MFWSFLFAEVVTLIILAAYGFALGKSKGLKTPLLLEPNFFQESLFAVADRKQGLTNELDNKILNAEIVKFIGDWLALVKKFSDTDKNDFTAIHARKDGDGMKVTLRSTGKLFDYGADSQALQLIQSLRGLESFKCTFTLGMNNLYLNLITRG